MFVEMKIKENWLRRCPLFTTDFKSNFPEIQ
jgi:hypothetical protein